MEIFKLNLTVTAYDITLTGLSLNGDLPVKWYLFIRPNKNLDWQHYSMRRTEMGLLKNKINNFYITNFYISYSFILGTVEIDILKTPRPYFWKSLQEDMFYDPPNQYLWWDMIYEKRK